MLPFKIRPFENDYSALAEIYNELYPDWPSTAEGLKISDEGTPAHHFRKYWIAEMDGKVAGAALLTHYEAFFHHKQYFFNIWVRKAFQNQGIGTALYQTVSETLNTLEVNWVQCAIPEHFESGIRFLEKRGYIESHRNFQSKYNLKNFDPKKYVALEQSLMNKKIVIKNLSELDTPNHRDEIYKIYTEIDRMIPGSDLRAARSFEDFWKSFDKKMSTGAVFLVAQKDNTYVGLHCSGPMPGSDWFNIMFTSVLPEFRNLGVATLLKAKGMEFGQKKGFSVLSTWNDSRNTPMLALNKKFEFERQPASISFIKRY